MATVAHIGLGLIAYVLCPLCVYINTERVAGGGIVCLELVLTYCIPCLVSASSHDDVVSMRIRVTMIISYLII
jgi:hypothetical protein